MITSPGRQKQKNIKNLVKFRQDYMKILQSLSTLIIIYQKQKKIHD